MKLQELIKEYETQDNRCTAYPIYVTVQSLRFVCVVDPLYAPSESNGDFYIQEEESSEDEYSEKVLCLYMYQDEEVFLTIKGAEEYLNANKHNLFRPRTYVKHFHRRNWEMRELLEEIGFKTKDTVSGSDLLKNGKLLVNGKDLGFKPTADGE